MLGLALVNLLVSGEPLPAEEGFHRGTGWYVPGSVPEPPVALALVIVAAAGMRVRERHLRRRGG